MATYAQTDAFEKRVRLVSKKAGWQKDRPYVELSLVKRGHFVARAIWLRQDWAAPLTLTTDVFRNADDRDDVVERDLYKVAGFLLGVKAPL